MKNMVMTAASLAGVLVCAACCVGQAAQSSRLGQLANMKKSAQTARTDLEADETREIRTWTSRKGSTVEAKLLETRGSQAVLVKEDGSKMVIAMTALSQEDQDYVKELIDAAAKERAGIVTVRLAPGAELEFLRVEPGEFQMGSELYAWGGPVHKVTITKPFYIGKFEVTVAQWKAFVEATGHETGSEKHNDGWGYKDGRVGHAPINWKKLGFEQTPDHPVVCVSQIDAKEFCKWASEQTGRTIRLPSEAEWEYAARGPESLQWPWGNKEDFSRFNHADASCKKAGVAANQWSDMADDGHAFTAPVGSYSNASWCGALDMAGNVREWVEDRYVPYQGGPAVDPVIVTGSETTVRRGGGWRDEFYFAHAARRDEHPAGDSNDELGFRCVLEP